MEWKSGGSRGEGEEPKGGDEGRRGGEKEKGRRGLREGGGERRGREEERWRCREE